MKRDQWFIIIKKITYNNKVLLFYFLNIAKKFTDETREYVHMIVLLNKRRYEMSETKITRAPNHRINPNVQQKSLKMSLTSVSRHFLRRLWPAVGWPVKPIIRTVSVGSTVRGH